MTAAGAHVVLVACGGEVGPGGTPSAISDSAILVHTAGRDEVDLEGVRTGG